MTFFFEQITKLGSWQSITILSIATIILLIIYDKKSYIFPFIFTQSISGILIYFIKVTVQRPRPILSLINETSFSFPSGHSWGSVAMFGFITYILVSITKKTTYIIPATILILLIGFSRLYLGVHYFSDIIGGYILGGITLLVGIKIHQQSTTYPHSQE